ncbi:unnamed protein product [Arctogadus glacialis]
MQSPNRAAAATQRETELLLLREAVQRLEQGPTFNEKTKQIQERPEEKGTLNGEIQDLKDMLEVKEQKVNDLQNGMENLQEQLRDKEKQMGSLKGRVKALQADTSNTVSALTRLVESLAEKEHIILRLNEQRFQDDQRKGEELVASRTMLEKMRVEHKMALEETAAGNEAQSMDWSREREALKAQLSGLMKELEENRQVTRQLSFNVGPQPQPIETRQDRRGTAPPGRAAQPRRRVRDVEGRDRIRQCQEGEKREHLIRKRNWLDADCMELQFWGRERQRIRFALRREGYGIQRGRVELRRQQEHLRFGQEYGSGKRSYRFQGGHWPGRANANTLSSRDAGCWSVRDACELTLDPNTADRDLSLSEDNRKVTMVGEDQSVFSWYRSEIQRNHKERTGVGVYLDQPAGSLSFYRVSPGGGGSSDTLIHLHTFWSSFTQEDLLPGVEESQRSALSALLKHSWTRRSVIMSDVMMRVDQEPVLWPGHMGLQVGGQRSEPVLWPGHMGLQVGGQSPSSGRVT